VTCAIILFFGAKGPLWVISVQPFWFDREAIQAKWVLFYAFAVFARHFRFGSTTNLQRHAHLRPLLGVKQT